MPFLGGKQGFSIKNKERRINKKTTKTNKDGLGPSEVALRATSPDPYTPKKTTKKKQNKTNKNKKK